MNKKNNSINRRKFLKNILLSTPCVILGSKLDILKNKNYLFSTNDDEKIRYGMGIDINKCIGCGSCVKACKNENNISHIDYFFRTWVERFIIHVDENVLIDSPNGGGDGFPPMQSDKEVLRTFFVPKTCNHCSNAPCVQVCPVGATFSTREGIVLVDEEYCIGCRYCIQACPYGARFIHPEKRVADKCTFCYHRIVKGLNPVCVEVCPAQARIFGRIHTRSSPLMRFLRFNKIQILKPHLNTDPQVFYANLDLEVK